jgi:hypothetical protein
MYRQAPTTEDVVIEPDTSWTVPVLTLKLKPVDPADNPDGVFSLVAKYDQLAQGSKDKSIVVEFMPDTVRSAVTSAMVDLYEQVMKNGGQIYLVLDNQEQEFLNAYGFTNLPKVHLTPTRDVAFQLAGASVKA